MKDTLAAIVALIRLTLKDGQSAEDFVDALGGRLITMARMHDLLAQRNWQGASLDGLIDSAVMYYVDAQKPNIERYGPDVMLKPNAASTLGMVLHELATNATRYGALSKLDGHIRVTWKIVGATGGSPGVQALSLHWIERDGPPVQVPSGDGFGASFVRRSVKYELNGVATLEFEPEGLKVHAHHSAAGHRGVQAR